jgi:hypothetical protein
MSEESTDFYKKLPMGLKNAHQVGQFFWVHAPMTIKNSFTLRIGRLKEGEDISNARLEVKKVEMANPRLGEMSAQDRVDMERMPIPEIKLGGSEDFVVEKVKMRPAVLIMKDCYNMRRFALGQHKGPNRHVFAPIYSLRKDDEQHQDFPEEFIENVKAEKYPNILYLPPYGTTLRNESMLVLSEMFSISIRDMRPMEMCIDPMTFGYLLGEFDSYLMAQVDELAEALETV